MSVLIKGMEMPECCAYCSFAYDCFLCTATGNEFIYRSEEEGGYIDFTETRMPDCPLIEVPPHGRLIEAEPIMKFITDGLNSGEFGYDQIKVLTEIQYAPTVIPADKDGEA